MDILTCQKRDISDHSDRLTGRAADGFQGPCLERQSCTGAEAGNRGPDVARTRTLSHTFEYQRMWLKQMSFLPPMTGNGL